MKKTTIIFILSILAIPSMIAQKFAFVDSEYILENIPSYKASQEQLDEISQRWQKEIEEEYTTIDEMYKSYQNERVLLTEQMRKKREDEIIKKEEEIENLKRKYFGPEGDLFQKRQELVKPIQDQVYNAIKEIATEGSYAAIFDTSSEASLVYTNPRYDLSDDVLKKLGYKD